MIAFALVPAVLAGSVYINGVRADLLPEVTLTNTTVRLDSEGNVWIDAPGYRVQVVQPGEYGGAAPPASQPVRTSPAPTSPAPPVTTGQSEPSSRGVPASTWWLVTQDDGSAGHTLEVLVNGALVRRVVSGEPQLILDIWPYLRRGANDILVQAVPGRTPSGGPLSIYVGRGNSLSGTLRLDNPDVAYSRRAADGPNSSSARQYTLTVP